MGSGLRHLARICVVGANAVPVDIFHSRQTPQAVRDLVASAADANMNMIRVWGGGLYFRDEFYDACDSAGLLVWQEAMFACSLYPANQAFLDDVRSHSTPASTFDSVYRYKRCTDMGAVGSGARHAGCLAHLGS